MYEDLSDVQLSILNYIKNELSEHGYPPSVREICAHTGLASTSSVHYQLKNLQKKGYLKRDSEKQRAIELVNDNPYGFNKDIVNVPIIGKVAAGTPILAYENYEDMLPLPASFVRSNECFILTVQGSSMINAGIFDGDYVIVRVQQSADNGDIVVAMIDDEATVKTLYKEDNRVRLQPENPLMAPIYSDHAVILGKVIGVVRKL
jgi:repressor LexA